MAIFSARTLLIVATTALLIYLASRKGGVTAVEVNTNVAGEAVDGKMTDWSDWSACSKDCGEGERSRQREYIPAVNGGADLSLDERNNIIEHEMCNPQPCAENGHFTEYGEWSACSESCGGGLRSRQREYVSAVNGGVDLSVEERAKLLEEEICNPQPCPVDGKMGEWSDWSACSKECEGGTQSRHREYIPAAHGGADLSLDERNNNMETQSCNPQPCPVNGSFGDWSTWSACSKPCGNGEKTRQRIYTPATNGGIDLADRDNTTETQPCNTSSCDLYSVVMAPGSYNQSGKIVYSENGNYRFLWQAKQYIYLQEKDDNWTWKNIASVYAPNYTGWGELNIMTGRFQLENYGANASYSVIGSTNILTASVVINNMGELVFVDGAGKKISTILKRGDNLNI